VSDNIKHLFAEALRYAHMRIDQRCDFELQAHDRRVEAARRSVGQTFRWAGRAWQ
jgi:hypothetical protein